MPKEFWTIWSSGCKAVDDALFADFEQLRLGRAEHLERGLALVRGAGDGRGADAHELAQQALVLDDADVLFDDRPARQTLGERRQVGHAADGLDLLVARASSLASVTMSTARCAVHQLAHAQEDAAMRVEREVVRLEALRRPRSGPHCPAGWRPGWSFRRRCSRAARRRELRSGMVAIPRV